MDLFGFKARRLRADMAAAAEAATQRAKREEKERRDQADMLAKDRHPTSGRATLQYSSESAIALSSTSIIWYDEKHKTLHTLGASDNNISRSKFETIADAAQSYGQKIMGGEGNTWHRFGDELLNVAALRWMKYRVNEQKLDIEGGTISGVTHTQFANAARDYVAVGALATGGKVSSIIQLKDELVNLNALGHHWYDGKQLRATNFALTITPRDWERVKVRQARYDRSLDASLTSRAQMLAQYGAARALATSPSILSIASPGMDTALSATTLMAASVTALAPTLPAFTSGGGGDFGGGGASGSFGCDGGAASCTP